MIKKITNILKNKIGKDFNKITYLYEDANNYVVYFSSNGQEEMPIAKISKKDFSVKFYPMIYTINENPDFLKGYTLRYIDDKEDAMNESNIRKLLKKYGVSDEIIENFIRDLNNMNDTFDEDYDDDITD